MENKYISLLSKLYFDSLDDEVYEILERKLKNILKIYPKLLSPLDVFGFLEWDLHSQQVIRNLPVLAKNSVIEKFLKLSVSTRKILNEAFVHYLSRIIGDYVSVVYAQKVKDKHNNNFLPQLTFSFSNYPIGILKITVHSTFVDLLKTNSSIEKQTIYYQKKEINNDWSIISLIQKDNKVDGFNNCETNIITKLEKDSLKRKLDDFYINEELEKFFKSNFSSEILAKIDFVEFIYVLLLPFLCGFRSYFVITKPIIKNLLKMNLYKTFDTLTPKYIIKLGTIGLSSNNKINLSYLKQLIIYHSIISTEDVIVDLSKNVLSYALRSAVAAIMVRNFAHHHGSHVIPRIKKDMDGIEEYLQYLNEKTALLNIINVYDPICEGKVNLKDALNYLEKSRGAKLFTRFFAEASGREKVFININDFKDEIIVSPGYGEIGVHAIYIIFENYLRNVLKYCKPPSGVEDAENGPLIEFYVEKDNNFAVIEIISNYVNVTDDSEKNVNEIKEIIEKNVNKIKEIIEKDEIIDEQGKTNFENAGIKEMRICANMLIGSPLGLKGGENLEVFAKNKSIGYRFKIPLAKYVCKGDRDTIEKIKAGEEVKPDFLVVDPQDSSFILQNWSVLPQKICWIGEEKDLQLDDKWRKWLSWVKRRSIFVKEKEYDACKTEREKYCLLLEKWWGKMFKDRGIKIKFCEPDGREGWETKYWSEIEELINSDNLEEYHFCHSSECNHKNGIKLKFSHISTYRICRYFGLDKEQCYLQKADEIKKKIVGLEIYSILAFKILIIDNELHDKFQENIKDLVKINISIIPENDSFSTADLKNYDCVVFHLGMLDVSPGLYDIEPDNLPPYIRIVTGRARPINDGILQKCLWANSRLLDRSVFISGLESEDILEKKYRIFWGVLK